MNIEDTLFVSDLDGTLLRDDQTLSGATTSFLNEAILQGLKFSYATARSITASQFVLHAVNLDNPVILYNGAQIYCPREKAYIHTSCLAPDDYEDILQRLLDDGLEPVVHCMNSSNELRVYLRSASNRSTSRWVNSRLRDGDRRFRLSIDFSEVDPGRVMEILAVAPKRPLEIHEACLAERPSLSCSLQEDIYCRDHYWLEICHREANKGHAVEILKRHLGLKHVVSFGDNHNDIPMFQVSDHSLAVKNSGMSVQESAHEVIGNNNEDAVIEYIRKQMAMT